MISEIYRRLFPKKIRDIIYKAFLGKLLIAIRLKKCSVTLLQSKIDDTREKQKYLRYIRNHLFFNNPLRVIFPATFIDKYVRMNPCVYYDQEIGLFYTIHNGKRLFWKEGMSEKTIKASYVRLLAEQDSSSPHKYFDDELAFDNKILFDLGSAEGIIVLDHIEEIQHAYLFECDEAWKMALQHTFEPYAGKVTVISKYVSDISTKSETSIDDFVNQTNVVPDIIKIDIEGYEERALNGMRNTMLRYHPYISCCLYHLPDAEEKIVHTLSSINDYHFSINPQYMFCIAFINTGSPYLRHGIVRAFQTAN